MFYKEYNWGTIMSNQQVGFLISWGKAMIPNVTYLCIDLPFLTIMIHIYIYNP